MALHRSYLTAATLVVLLSSPAEGGGQEGARGRGTPSGSREMNPGAPESGRSWWTLWSLPSPHDRIFLGMWTFHPFGDDPYPQEANNGFGLQYRGIFAFTCVNSFERRTYAAGMERVWLDTRVGPGGLMLGYRVGLVTGYETELFQIGDDTPVLPFVGTVALLRLGPVGAEISWVYKAVSLVGAVFLPSLFRRLP